MDVSPAIACWSASDLSMWFLLLLVVVSSMHTCNIYVTYKNADWLLDSVVLIGQKQFQILAKTGWCGVAHAQIDLRIIASSVFVSDYRSQIRPSVMQKLSNFQSHTVTHSRKSVPQDPRKAIFAKRPVVTATIDPVTATTITTPTPFPENCLTWIWRCDRNISILSQFFET